jgi:hypothetical protein
MLTSLLYLLDRPLLRQVTSSPSEGIGGGALLQLAPT